MTLDRPLCYIQTSRKLELLELTSRLENERKDLETEVKKRKIIAHNEQADVDNLEAPGLKGFFLGLTGKKQERMEQEQAGARSAKQSFETAQASLAATANQLSIYREELSALGNCDDDLRRFLELPEDSELVKLNQLLSDIPGTQEEITKLIGTLTKVSEWGSVRAATAATAGLAGTDDRLRAIECNAQEMLGLLIQRLTCIRDNAAAFGVSIDIHELEHVEGNYLTDLYTSALIDIRVSNITLKLRQIRLQLDAAYPRICRIIGQKHKDYLRTLLDFADK